MSKQDIRIQTNEYVIRLIEEKDQESMIKWRNDPVHKQWFFYQGEFNLQTQIIWFHEYLTKDNDYTFVLEIDDIPVGMAAIYDIHDDQGEFGRLLIGEIQGKGLGKELARQVCQIGFTRLNLNTIVLEVFKENERALKIYQELGFKIIEERPWKNRFIYVMELNINHFNHWSV